jgi:hypothetical protein
LWQHLTEEITPEMGEWRNQHPKATLREIETELATRLSRMRARMLEDLALASASATWTQISAAVPLCPDCHQPLDDRGTKRRSLLTHSGQQLELARSYIDYHYAEALRILDHPQAAEHITLIGQTSTPDGPLLSAAECTRLRQELKRDGPDDVLAELRTLVETQEQLPELSKALAYLEKRQAMMRYPQFAADAWPLGSGMVESANTLVVEDGLKGSGMHWVVESVTPMGAAQRLM